MTPKSKPVQIPLPGGSGVAKTGAVQFRGDWPGLFVRGDHAIAISMSIRELQSRLSETTDVRIASALHRLVKLADLIEQDVKVS